MRMMKLSLLSLAIAGTTFSHAAIAEEENLPPIVAVMVGCNLLRSHGGLEHMRNMLRNRAKRAVDRGDHASAATHLRTYEDFRRRCPQPIRD